MWIWTEVNEFCTKIFFLLLLITLLLPEIVLFLMLYSLYQEYSTNLETTHLEYNMCWIHIYNIDLLKSSKKCIHICLYHKILTSSIKQKLVTLITFHYNNILLLYRFVLVLCYQNLVDAYQIMLPLYIVYPSALGCCKTCV